MVEPLYHCKSVGPCFGDALQKPWTMFNCLTDIFGSLGMEFYMEFLKQGKNGEEGKVEIPSNLGFS